MHVPMVVAMSGVPERSALHLHGDRFILACLQFCFARCLHMCTYDPGEACQPIGFICKCAYMQRTCMLSTSRYKRDALLVDHMLVEHISPKRDASLVDHMLGETALDA